jgi:hypothetical protein
MRKAGLIATLFAGLGLLGASLHGMTRVDTTLRIAAATPAPKIVHPDYVLERHHRGRDCDRKGPRV